MSYIFNMLMMQSAMMGAANMLEMGYGPKKKKEKVILKSETKKCKSCRNFGEGICRDKSPLDEICYRYYKRKGRKK